MPIFQPAFLVKPGPVLRRGHDREPASFRRLLAKIRNADALDTLDERLAGMLKHAEKLTTNPHQVSADDVQKLRDLGLSDSDILDITLVTAYFNFVNRIALGLGVAYSEEEVQGYES